MLVQRKLIPFLRHFHEMMPVEKFPDDARIARGGLAKVVYQLELGVFVVPGTDDGLHDLDEHPARIIAERGLGAVQHLVAEDAQGHEPVRSAAGFEVAEQVDDRVGHPVLVGRRQFQDAMRMKIGVKDLVLKVLRGAVIDRFVDHTQEFTILLVERKCSEHGQS